MSLVILPIVIGVVRNQNGHFLLGRRNQPDLPSMHGKWNLLGGKIEPNETPEEAVIREIKEECGLDIEIRLALPEQSVRHREKSDGTKLKIIATVYDCLVDAETIVVNNDDPGVSELRFFPPHEVLDTDMMEEDKILVKLVI